MFGLIPYTGNISRRNVMTPFASEFFRNFFDAPVQSGFRVDLLDAGDHYSLEAELPGIRREDVQVSIENGVLTIAASTAAENEQKTDSYVYRERRTGTMKRAFSLECIREDDVSGEYRDGILRLTLPKDTDDRPAKRLVDIT